jgi:branched-chain amino acid aminotransferase
MKLPVFKCLDDILQAMPAYNAQDGYHAMYSSIFSGITTNPQLMMIPVDDHLVHRGDGVFEAFQMLDGRVHLFDAHLNRLERSAKAIELSLRHSHDEIKDICQQLIDSCGLRNALFRLYASRGPGGFTPNPYDSIGPQMYIIVSSLHQPNESLYEHGVKVGFSKVAVKSGGMAKAKTCNYISNVLMTKEAIDNGFDFVINITDDGYLGEGATENMVFLTPENDLIFSSFDHTLRGTTLLRLQELSGELVNLGLIREMKESKQKVAQLMDAKEAFMIGTSLNALPISEVAGKLVGDGKPGKVTIAARNLLREDQKVGGHCLI